MDRIDDMEVAGEHPHGRQPVSVPPRRGVDRRERRPRDRRCVRHDIDVVVLEIGDEIVEEEFGAGQFESHSSTDGQIVDQVLTQTGHDCAPIGQA